MGGGSGANSISMYLLFKPDARPMEQIRQDILSLTADIGATLEITAPPWT